MGSVGHHMLSNPDSHQCSQPQQRMDRWQQHFCFFLCFPLSWFVHVILLKNLQAPPVKCDFSASISGCSLLLVVQVGKVLPLFQCNDSDMHCITVKASLLHIVTWHDRIHLPPQRSKHQPLFRFLMDQILIFSAQVIWFYCLQNKTELSLRGGFSLYLDLL